MPRGPKGEKRPADVIGAAVKVMQIATGEIEEDALDPGKEYARKGGLKGGQARAESLTPEKRSEIARLAAEARWTFSAVSGSLHRILLHRRSIVCGAASDRHKSCQKPKLAEYIRFSFAWSYAESLIGYICPRYSLQSPNHER